MKFQLSILVYCNMVYFDAALIRLLVSTFFLCRDGPVLVIGVEPRATVSSPHHLIVATIGTRVHLVRNGIVNDIGGLHTTELILNMREGAIAEELTVACVARECHVIRLFTLHHRPLLWQTAAEPRLFILRPRTLPQSP